MDTAAIRRDHPAPTVCDPDTVCAISPGERHRVGASAEAHDDDERGECGADKKNSGR
jgi:hypothetical protein